MFYQIHLSTCFWGVQSETLWESCSRWEISHRVGSESWRWSHTAAPILAAQGNACFLDGPEVRKAIRQFPVPRVVASYISPRQSVVAVEKDGVWLKGLDQAYRTHVVVKLKQSILSTPNNVIDVRSKGRIQSPQRLLVTIKIAVAWYSLALPFSPLTLFDAFCSINGSPRLWPDPVSCGHTQDINFTCSVISWVLLVNPLFFCTATCALWPTYTKSSVTRTW